MPDYQRARVAGVTYFFTVNLLERYPNDLLVRHVDVLCDPVGAMKSAARGIYPADWAGGPDIDMRAGEPL